MGRYVDDVEAGYAEKFESITGVQHWKISSTNCFGIFKNDPRYSKDLLIKELKGHDVIVPINLLVSLSQVKKKD